MIGLNKVSSRVPHNPAYFPISGCHIFVPFLVVEAKKENAASGFRAIQHQAAFAIRRLLKAQQDLYQQDPLAEPCLVWFFAHQGDQWRLHAGTLENNQVVSSNYYGSSINANVPILEAIRSLARNNTISRWCPAIATHCRLHMVLGSGRLSAVDQKDSLWLPGRVPQYFSSVDTPF